MAAVLRVPPAIEPPTDDETQLMCALGFYKS